MTTTYKEGDWIWHQKKGIGEISLSSDKELLVEFENGKDEIFELNSKKQLPIVKLSNDGFWLRKKTDIETLKNQINEKPIDLLELLLIDKTESFFNDKKLKKIIVPELVPDEKWEEWYKLLINQVETDPRFEIEKTGKIVYQGELSEINDDLIVKFKQAPSMKEKHRIVKQMILLEEKGVQMDDLRETAITFFAGTNVGKTNKMGARMEALIFLEELDRIQYSMLKDIFYEEIQSLDDEGSAEAIAETNENYVRSKLLSVIQELNPDRFIDIVTMITKRFKKTQRDWVLDELLSYEDKGPIKKIVSFTMSDIATNLHPFIWIFKTYLDGSAKILELGYSAEDIISSGFRIVNHLHYTADFQSNPKDGMSISREEDELVKLLKNEKKIFNFLEGQTEQIIMNVALKYESCAALETQYREELLNRIKNKWPELKFEDQSDDAIQSEYRLSRATYELFKKEYQEIIDDKLPNATNDIKTAREFGDISENYELTVAQERQRMLLGRKNELERVFESCEIIE